MNDGVDQMRASLQGYEEEDLREAIELLFFAYRDFTGEADTVLANFGFGRAHHRAIYFIARNPGIFVSDLLGILKITKQSLSRVLTQLIKEGYVRHQIDKTDRRRRLLELSQKGEDLERQLTARQCTRIIKAFEAAGVGSISGFHSILREMIDPADQDRVNQHVNYLSKDDKRRLAG